MRAWAGRQTGAAVVLVCAAVVAGAQSADRPSLGDRLDERAKAAIPRDSSGRPVADALGIRINYPRDAGKPEVAPAARRGGRPSRIASSPVASNNSFQLKWQKRVMGTGIGDRGLHIVDLDGDGDREIVATASQDGFWENSAWYTLAWNGSDYVHDWIPGSYPEPIGTLLVLNMDEDPTPEVVVATGDQILIYDGATRVLQSTISLNTDEIREMAIADVDSDGALEAVLVGDDGLFIHGLPGGVLEYQSAAYPGYTVAVGNVDTDPGLEIVIGNGDDTGYVLNGSTRAVEWAPVTGFGNIVRLGDIDGDGISEVVAASSWYVIRIYDVDLHSITDSIDADQDIDALEVVDVEGDGPIEIVYGDGQGGEIYVHNGASRALKWMADNPEHGVTGIAFGDADGDGVRELVWGAGYSSTGPDYLFVVNAVTRALEWKSDDIVGPFAGFSHGDVDLDGRRELLSTSYRSDSGYGDGLLLIQDAETGQAEYAGETTGLNWTGTWRVRNANIDADPQPEIFVATSYLYDGVVICYDGLTRAEQWRAQIPSGQTIRSLAVADVDLDGQLEVVAGTNIVHSGASGTYVYVFAAATGAQEWRSPLLTTGSSLDLLRVANVDADPNPEIVVVSDDGVIFIIDGVLHTTTPLSYPDASALATADRNGDSVAEIFLGTNSGALVVINPASGALVETVASWSDPIHAISVVDVNGIVGLEYVAAVGNEVVVLNSGGCEAWRSGAIAAEAVAAHDGLLAADIDGNGKLEIVVGVDAAGFDVFELDALPTSPCMTVNGVSVAEGQAGTTQATFTLSLSAPAAGAVTANWATSDGTASEVEGDYVTASGVVSFNPGEQTQQISVTINGDQRNEADETFLLTFTGASGVLLTTSPAVGVIVNDDPLPTLSVNDVAVIEGNAGLTLATFTVTLSAASGRIVTVTANTSHQTTTPGDFFAENTVLVFSPGDITRSFGVLVAGDTTIESDETFQVNLPSAMNAVIGDSTGIGTIVSDDLPTRTFVSASGSDAADCSVQTTPCRNIAAALSKTATDGEIIILKTGEYETSPLTITKGIKITSPSGTVAFIRQPITINAPGARVALRGLTLKGDGTGSGVTVTAADSVSIEETTIDRWASGMKLNNASPVRIFVLDSVFRNNTSGLEDDDAVDSSVISIGESRFEGNGNGLTSGAGLVQVKDSSFVGNPGFAIAVGLSGVVQVHRSDFRLNGVAVATFAGGTARVGRSHVFGNDNGFFAIGGVFETYGTNILRGNATDAMGTITAIPEQ